jgi:hypothetical protein
MQNIRYGTLGFVLAICLIGPEPASGGKEKGWIPLFNGKDLNGWDTWLGRPHGEKEIVGLNKDPRKVYTVVDEDGKPAIRISGEIFGALTSHKEFENYHLKLEFKWGEKRWPPREKAVRDSGLLYHCVGPHGAAGSFWMQSQELQIQEHDCGDYWSVAGGIVDVEGYRKDGKGPVIYKKGGDKFTVPSKDSGGPRIVKSPDKEKPTLNSAESFPPLASVQRIVNSPDNEKPTGQWNTIELLTVGGTSVHIVNGKVVMVLTNSRRLVETKEVRLTGGKIQLQSEGAEVFYRNIAYRPIAKIPDVPTEYQDIKKLKQERLETARKGYEIAEGQVRFGTKWPGFSLPWARRVLDSHLDLASSKNERVKALETYWRMTKDLEEFAKKLSESRQIHALDLFDAQFQRLEAEIRLLEEKAK